jgi:glycosyltransferase involved in cell wall biosynthesis
MSDLTAIVTNHNYARYLPDCLESAIRFCDRVIVYDDGSDDASLDIINHYGLRHVHRKNASGGPVLGSNWGIRNTFTSHLIFLDADNFLLRRPDTDEVDYTFYDISLANENGDITGRWSYPNWPTEWQACLDLFKSQVIMPYPWGGVWRTSFTKGKRWRYWDSTKMAADFRTAIDWCLEKPTIAYGNEPVLAFRTHDGQWSASPDRTLMEQEARGAVCDLTSIGETPRSPG